MFTDQAVSCPILPFLGALGCSAGIWSIVETERSIRTTSEAGEQVQPMLSEETSPMHLHLGRFYILTYSKYPKTLFQVDNKNLQLHMHSAVWGLWCVCRCEIVLLAASPDPLRGVFILLFKQLVPSSCAGSSLTQHGNNKQGQTHGHNVTFWS